MATVNRDHIGPYRILKLIRAGKATHVWEAMNAIDNKRVAIKSLREEFVKDKLELATLRHEHTVGSTLDHPNINRVIEFNVSRGMPYVVMDYFNAPNLKQSLREYPERVSENLPQIVRQAASGLNHLHEVGWVHRDVKPDNYLMDETADVRLIDFAIAQRVKKGFGKFLSGKSAIQGTRSYMSPEQIRGGNVDQRSDIYSFGCTVFELVAGRPPFTGNNPDDLLTKHLKAPVPSVAAMSDLVSTDFSQLIVSTMQKKPEQRPESLTAVLEQLDQMRVLKRRRTI